MDSRHTAHSYERKNITSAAAQQLRRSHVCTLASPHLLMLSSTFFLIIKTEPSAAASRTCGARSDEVQNKTKAGLVGERCRGKQNTTYARKLQTLNLCTCTSPSPQISRNKAQQRGGDLIKKQVDCLSSNTPQPLCVIPSYIHPDHSYKRGTHEGSTEV